MLAAALEGFSFAVHCAFLKVRVNVSGERVQWGRVKGESLTVERQLWLTLCHLVVALLSVTAGAEGCW